MADPVVPAVAATSAASTAVATPVATATPAAEATLLTAPPAAAATEVPAVDATKNADGTDKTPEQIAADKKTAEDAAKAKPEGAPEKYTDFTAPEGMTLDTEGVTALQTFAKENNLSQANAQKLVDLAVKNAQTNAANQAKQWADARTTWVAEIKADKEVGGANFPASVALAQKAIAQFGSPELNKVMESGYGDNPAMFKFCVAIGKRLGEDKVVNGTTGSGDVKSVAQQLYASHK